MRQVETKLAKKIASPRQVQERGANDGTIILPHAFFNLPWDGIISPNNRTTTQHSYFAAYFIVRSLQIFISLFFHLGHVLEFLAEKVT
jgi:hypothetical protein